MSTEQHKLYTESSDFSSTRTSFKTSPAQNNFCNKHILIQWSITENTDRIIPIKNISYSIVHFLPNTKLENSLCDRGDSVSVTDLTHFEKQIKCIQYVITTGINTAYAKSRLCIITSSLISNVSFLSPLRKPRCLLHSINCYSKA